MSLILYNSIWKYYTFLYPFFLDIIIYFTCLHNEEISFSSNCVRFQYFCNVYTFFTIRNVICTTRLTSCLRSLILLFFIYNWPFLFLSLSFILARTLTGEQFPYSGPPGKEIISERLIASKIASRDRRLTHAIGFDNGKYRRRFAIT